MAKTKSDRRVVRTRDTLGDALIALMHQKDFDDITVQDLLDRAGVGRSTFYVHYRNKEDLFLSDVEDFFEIASTMLKRQSADAKRLAPVTELFAHVRQVRDFYQALVRAGKVADVFAMGREFFARSIEDRLQNAGVALEPLALAAHAHSLSGSFFALFEWWIAKGMKIDPAKMDKLFHQAAWRGLGPARRE